MSQQSRSLEALAAVLAEAANAERAARNINRLRGNRMDPPRDPVNPDQMIQALTAIHEITGRLARTVTHYAHALRWTMSGYSGSGGIREDYPSTVLDAAAHAEHALMALAKQLGYGAPIGPSTDAIADLDIAVADWRTRQRARRRAQS